jgi:hypothetical protein
MTSSSAAYHHLHHHLPPITYTSTPHSPITIATSCTATVTTHTHVPVHLPFTFSLQFFSSMAITITHFSSPSFPLPSTRPVTYSLLTYSLLHAYSISNHYHNHQYLHSPTTAFFCCTSRYVPPSPISITIAISSLHFPSY